MIFETHAHYDDRQFDVDREALLAQMPGQGIDYIVNVGADIASTKRSIELAEAYPFVYAAAGVHPSDADELDEVKFAWLSQQTAHEKVVAVGEIGLDYYWEKDEQARRCQQFWFKRQLELARKVKLPVIIHSREAAKDTLDIMQDLHAEEIGGVIHCYSYSLEMAKIYLKQGYFLGIGGVLTYKNARNLVETVAYAPLEQLVIETDSPYLTPVPNRGKRNSSLNLPYVVSKIAGIKGISEEEVMEVTMANAKRLYRLQV